MVKGAAVVTVRTAVGAAIGTSGVGEFVGVAVGIDAGSTLGAGPPTSLLEPAVWPDKSMDWFSLSPFNKRFHSFLLFAESSAFLIWFF